MYKLKKSSSISKRFKKTGRNKLLRRRAGRSHLLQKKIARKKQQLRKTIVVNYRDYLSLKACLP